MKNITDTYKLNNGVEIPCMGLGTWQVKELAIDNIGTSIE